MIVRRACYRNFRNITDAKIDFSPGVNVLYGGNAQGKTSAIEGIYICSSGRSHRTVHDNELIKHNETFGTVKIDFEDISRRRELELIFLKNGRKCCNIGDIPVKKTSEFIGIFKAVIFCPEHLSIIKQGPSSRRNFLDRSIAKDDKSYMEALQNYVGILVRRNKLLNDMMLGDMSSADTLDSWNIQLARYAAIISIKRHEYIKRLNEYLGYIFKDMTNGRETPNIVYNGGYSEEGLLKKLNAMRAREIKSGVTLCGIHKDDMGIYIDSKDARVYGSQGQQRSLAIALKLSEGEITRDISGQYPVYLLDDILSELDEKRRNYLISGFSTKENERQVIITCCDDSLLKNKKNANKIYVEKGSYKKDLF